MKQAVFNCTDAAYYLGLREGTVVRATRHGTIPYRRIGRRILFIKADLDTWLSLLPGVSVVDAVAAQHAHTDAMTRRRRRPVPALQATA